MTSLLHKFQNKITNLRKDKSPLAKAAQLVMAKATAMEKANQPRETTDSDLVNSLNYNLKGLRVMEGYILDSYDQKDLNYIQDQIELFEEFLPKQLTQKDLIVAISGIIATVPAADGGMKGLGIVMKELKMRYPDRYDGKEAVTLFKDIIS